MASQAQIDANRRNAQRSTGPKTAEGKAAVSRNALKHGLRSEIYNQPAQHPEVYEQVLADLIAEHRPQTMTEEFYVERMALCIDKLVWLEAVQNECLYGTLPTRNSDIREEKALNIYWNQQERLERAFDRALAALRKLQKERRTSQVAAPASQDDDPNPAAVSPRSLPVPRPRPEPAREAHSKKPPLPALEPIPEKSAS